jgi:hypothetical protein
MTTDQREIQRKLRILRYAEEIGHVAKTCRYFGVQTLPSRPNTAGGVTAAPPGDASGTGARMLAELSRLGRLGRR